MSGPGGTVEHLGAVLDARGARDPDLLAVIAGDESVTYGALAARVRGAASALRARGLQPGDRVMVADLGGVLILIATLAVLRAGATAVVVDPNLAAPELAALAEGSGPVRLAIGGAPFVDHLRGGLDVPVLADADLVAADDGVEPADPDTAIVLFTSGTTGRPKPIAMSADVVRTRLAPYADSPDPHVRMLCTPVFHIGGLIGALVSLVGGHTLVVQRRFEAGEWLRLVEQHQVRQMFLVPAMLRKILDHPDFATRDHTSLTMLTYGAAPMPPQLIARALDEMPTVGFANTWGQTETLGGITILSPEDHRHPVRRHSVGQAVPGVQMRVLDPATGAELPAGAVGELQTLSSQNVTAGWHGTGDLGHIDEDGYVYVSGRLSDVINRGGEKVGPVEVEDVLRAHPQVDDVAVVGVPDDVLGQRIGAAVVARRREPASGPHEHSGELDAAALQQWCEGKVARFKTPERVVLVDAIPYSQLGKVDRKAVLRMIQEIESGETS